VQFDDRDFKRAKEKIITRAHTTDVIVRDAHCFISKEETSSPTADDNRAVHNFTYLKGI